MKKHPDYLRLMVGAMELCHMAETASEHLRRVAEHDPGGHPVVTCRLRRATRAVASLCAVLEEA